MKPGMRARTVWYCKVCGEEIVVPISLRSCLPPVELSGTPAVTRATRPLGQDPAYVTGFRWKARQRLAVAASRPVAPGVWGIQPLKNRLRAITEVQKTRTAAQIQTVRRATASSCSCCRWRSMVFVVTLLRQSSQYVSGHRDVGLWSPSSGANRGDCVSKAESSISYLNQADSLSGAPQNAQLGGMPGRGSVLSGCAMTSPATG